MKKSLLSFFLFVLTLTGCSSTTTEFSPWDNLGGNSTSSTSDIDEVDIDIYDPSEKVTLSSSQLVTNFSNALKIDLENLSALENSVQYENNTLTITSGGIYLLEGNFDCEIIVKKCDDETIQIVLNNANIASTKGPSILFEKTSGLRILTIIGTNYLNGCENEENAIIVSKKSSLTINGNGILNIDASATDTSGIKVKKELTIINTTININASKNGIKADDFINIQNANITISCLNDGIKTDKEASTQEEAEELSSSLYNGYIYIKNSSIEIIAKDDGISANNGLYIDNDTTNLINITTNEGTPNSITEYSSDNASGKALKVAGISLVDENTNTETKIKAKFEENYILFIKNGNFTLNSNDDAITSKGNVIILNGTLNISSGDDGIHTEYITAIKDGNITISNSYEGIEGASVEIYGGNISIVSFDDGINAANSDLRNYDFYIYIKGGNIFVNAQGDGVDSNGWIKIEGGNITIYGPTGRDNGSLDSETGVLVTGGNLIALGSLGMVENPSSNSSQYYVSINLNSSVSLNTSIIVKDSNDNELVNISPSKQYQSVIISLEDFKKNETYTITIGNYTYQATLTKIGTALGVNSFGQGNQGFRPGRR